MIKLEDVLTLANVHNLTTLIKGYVDDRISALSTAVSGIFGEVDSSLDSLESSKATKTDLTAHTGSTSNPHSVTKSQIGLGNVENKNSEAIRNEITKTNVTNALGYTPPTKDTTYGPATASAEGLMPAASILKFANLSVLTSGWVSDSTYSDFPYKASIACLGITEEHVGDVVFDVVEAISGNYAPVCLTAANLVYIYAKEKPSATITIPTIVARKAVN